MKNCMEITSHIYYKILCYCYYQKYIIMRQQIERAVEFLSTFIDRQGTISQPCMSSFRIYLVEILMNEYTDHWYIDKPTKGQGYRCLRINSEGPTESRIADACKKAGIDYDCLNLPMDITIWVDPDCVSYRFGDDGSDAIIAIFENTIDEEDTHRNLVEQIALGTIDISYLIDSLDMQDYTEMNTSFQSERSISRSLLPYDTPFRICSPLNLETLSLTSSEPLSPTLSEPLSPTRSEPLSPTPSETLSSTSSNSLSSTSSNSLSSSSCRSLSPTSGGSLSPTSGGSLSPERRYINSTNKLHSIMYANHNVNVFPANQFVQYINAGGHDISGRSENPAMSVPLDTRYMRHMVPGISTLSSSQPIFYPNYKAIPSRSYMPLNSSYPMMHVNNNLNMQNQRACRNNKCMPNYVSKLNWPNDYAKVM